MGFQFSKQINCKANDGANAASNERLFFKWIFSYSPKDKVCTSETQKDSNALGSKRIPALSDHKPNDISKNNQDCIGDFPKAKVTLDTEMNYVSSEKLIRILYNGCRGYSFSLKAQAVQSLFSLSIWQYTVGSGNNVINNDIKDLSQWSHLHPFIPAGNLLQQTGKDTHNLKQALQRALHHRKFSLVAFGFVCFQISVVIKQAGFKKQSHLTVTMGFLGGSVVKNLPASAEQVPPLCQEEPLEKRMAARSTIPAWETPWTEEPGGATVHGVTKELDMT